MTRFGRAEVARRGHDHRRRHDSAVNLATLAVVVRTFVLLALPVAILDLVVRMPSPSTVQWCLLTASVGVGLLRRRAVEERILAQSVERRRSR